MKAQCSMTGVPINDPSDGIWDDGEWISWDYVNRQIENYPEGGLLEEMMAVAKEYFEQTGRHLPIYGAIGEQYAARRFGIDLHDDPIAEGSDGKVGNVLVEIKTISPLRDTRQVRVKKSGNFGALVIVKIDADFRIDAQLIRRRRLPKTDGEYYRLSWGDLESEQIAVDAPSAGL